MAMGGRSWTYLSSHIKSMNQLGYGEYNLRQSSGVYKTKNGVVRHRHSNWCFGARRKMRMLVEHHKKWFEMIADFSPPLVLLQLFRLELGSSEGT